MSRKIHCTLFAKRSCSFLFWQDAPGQKKENRRPPLRRGWSSLWRQMGMTGGLASFPSQIGTQLMGLLAVSIERLLPCGKRKVRPLDPQTVRRYTCERDIIF